MIEILAPVGNFEMLSAAVRSGANAVYLGVSEFNARRNAKNFALSDLSSVISYSHIRGVRVYLTLNTLVFDTEILKVLEIVKTACNLGIDAVIVQDLGLAKLISKAAPTLELHASTQMSIHTLSGVKYLKSLGFKRVVLARENTYQELKEIAYFANKNDIELEIFVQGALCMSVSGQCLFSAALGSRSGNRGLCAGTCRLPFSVNSPNSNGYDLSLKDLNLYNEIGKLKELNIASLKIEGRMKRPEYVAMAVEAARTAVINANDLDLKIENLQNIFSRSGFTNSYFTGSISSDIFGIRSENDIELTKQNISKTHEIYRNELQSVGITFDCEIKENQPIKLTICDSTNKTTAYGDTPTLAKNKPIDQDFITDKLKKSGGTPYYVTDVNLNLDSNLYLSATSLSTLKNEAINKLNELRARPNPIPFSEVNINEFTASQTKSDMKLYVSVHNFNQLCETNLQILKELNVKNLILPLFSENARIIKLKEQGFNIITKTPPALFSNETKILEKLKSLKEIGVNTAICENIGAILLIQEAKMKLIAGAGLNICNTPATTYNEFEEILLSYELSQSQINSLKTNKPKGIVVYGKMPLMLLRSCPIKQFKGCTNCDEKITDRKGIDFTIMCEDNATRLYNSVPTVLYDKKDLFKNLNFIQFNFTNETANEVQEILNNYKHNKPLPTNFTRGLIFKGVL